MSLDDLDTLRAACWVAGLDEHVSTEESRLLRVLAKRAGVGSASLEAMEEQAARDPSFFEQQLAFLTKNPDRVVKSMFQVAVADGRLGAEERIMIQHFADRLGLEPQRCEAILAAAEREVSEGG